LKKPVRGCREQMFSHLLFLNNDEDYNVETEEVEEIDFTKIAERLERGE